MHKQSKKRSYQFIPRTDIILVNSKNYIDSNGSNPKEYTEIDGRDVVFEKNLLTKDKWLFAIDDVIIRESAIKQIKKMISQNVWLIIQNDNPFQKKKKEWRNLYKNGESIDNIENEHIEGKYYNIEECLKHIEIPLILEQQFINGDQIWFYNTVKNKGGTQALILVRDNKIVCSPITIMKLYDRF